MRGCAAVVGRMPKGICGGGADVALCRPSGHHAGATQQVKKERGESHLLPSLLPPSTRETQLCH